MIQRQTAFSTSNFYLKQNPGDAHFTVEDLQQMQSQRQSSQFISKVSRYAANLSGTAACWRKIRDDLKAIITHKGAPTFFFTFSAADMHWPELHTFFDTDCTHSPSDNRKNIINNPHLVDRFFTKRIEAFMKHWLYDTLDADWHWYRHEHQGVKGSIHCHGPAKLKNDPGLCDLTEKALKGFWPRRSQKTETCSHLNRKNKYKKDWKLLG